MLIWPYSSGSPDPGFCGGGCAEGLHRSAPAEVGRRVFGGDAVEAPAPLLQSTMVGVHVVDVILRRLRLRIARRGQDVDIELGAPRERRDGRSSIAAKVRRRGHDAAERRGELTASSRGKTASSVAPVRSRATMTGICSSDRPRLTALPPRLREGLGRPFCWPLKDSRMNVSSASTMPDRDFGLSWLRAERKR